MNSFLKKFLICSLLYIPKMFGLVWLYKFLFNYKKIYSPKEILINWLTFLILFLFITSIAVYTYYVKNEKHLTKDDLKTMDVWGTIIFFTFIMTMVIVPFKIYFRKKRKRETYENNKST